jgi:H+/Cl- antiporter ClcA
MYFLDYTDSGYIFPLMCSGAAFGRLLYYFLPDTVPLQLAVLCTAAGMNVAITRTSLATTLILAFLSGEPCAIPGILMASICSLFATSYMVSSPCSTPNQKC